MAAHPNGRCRIVLTGGPGGGKTTAADLVRREIGERVVLFPEAATMIFMGGVPRCTEDPGILGATSPLRLRASQPVVLQENHLRTGGTRRHGSRVGREARHGRRAQKLRAPQNTVNALSHSTLQFPT